jgi:acyl-CoA thioesterase I
MRRPCSAILLCILFAMPQPSWAGIELDHVCNAQEEFFAADASLAQFDAAVAAGGPVNVLAVGSATTVGSVMAGGVHSAAQGGAFPWHLVRTLHTALPSVDFRLTVRGGRGMTAEDMLPLIDGALKQQHYPLVLWQTGTVEAVRGLQPSGMLDILQTGAERVRDAGGDLVLIDPQFSRFLRANTDIDPYESVMQQVATMPGVALFRRFELMRAWANGGQIDLERTQAADRDKALDALNACLGKALARFVLSGIHHPPAGP